MTQEEQDEAKGSSPEIRLSPDGLKVAIRTQFDDDSPGDVKAYQYASFSGHAGFLGVADVKDWEVLRGVEGG